MLKELITDYWNKGALTDAEAKQLLTNKKNLSDHDQALQLFGELDDQKSWMIWTYIMHQVWGDHTDKESRIETIFDQTSNTFFRTLMDSNGLVSRKRMMEVLGNDHFVNKAKDQLEYLDLIDTIKLRNQQIYYIMKLDFYKRATSNERQETRQG